MNNLTIKGNTEIFGVNVPKLYGGFGDNQRAMLAKTIAEIHGKKICMTKLFNPLIRGMSSISIVRKVFGNLVYDKSISQYCRANYIVRTFRESIELTEIGKIKK